MFIFTKRFLFLITIPFFIFQISIHANDTEKTNAYFQKIRDNQAMLTAFFNGMPKGGDLHHHFSGSVYAEKYFELAVKKNFYINLETGDSFQNIPLNLANDPNVQPINSLIEAKGYLPVKLKLISLWSIKDFKETQQTPDKHFFEAFRKFGPLIKGNEDVFLKEIKERAIIENVQYIETMFLRPDYDKKDPKLAAFSSKYIPNLLKIQEERLELDGKEKAEVKLSLLFDEMVKTLTVEMQYEEVAKRFAEAINIIHQKSKLPVEDEQRILIRYQNYITRTDNPAEVFVQIFLSFQSDNVSNLIVGTNIVGPEDNPNAMRDYWLHMEMFKYFHKKFPTLKYSLHAGELSVGIVPPEDLSWHINSALFDAEANRIGHGVDIPYETDCYALLEHMKEKKVPVEINMLSNEFILGIKNDFHPLLLYHNSGVPIVITSDDMGVLRTSFTEQFAILAKRYKEISYYDIKGFIYNSIQYSFLSKKDKKKLKKKVDKEFVKFEERISRIQR
ncbi:MAG: adenosine deaminase [Leptospiraceae bacterium]|nr:adenosine deaminase [Leptospiraceae bacterium]